MGYSSGYAGKGASTWSSPSVKGGKSWGKGKDDWGKGKDKGKGKGKKGKEKGPGAPDADDPYWTEKVSEENRVESGEGSMFVGKVTNYNFRAGWGFVTPESPEELPEDVQAAMAKAAEEQIAKGKTVDNPYMIYFRKPDVVEGYQPKRDAQVTFQVYTDDKGAGACNIAGVDA